MGLAKDIIGAPSFVVDGRIFFGNDRLSLVRHFALKGAARGGWPVHRRIRLIS